MKSVEKALTQRQQEIAERIARLIAEKGWTQKELATRAGLKESYISKVLHAESNLTLRTITIFEVTLGTSIIQTID